MKKYIIILAAAVLGLVFSCNDKLDLTTDGRISRGEIFQDRYKIMGWLNGCYNYCPGVSLTRAGYTDETHHSDAGTSNGQNYYNFYQGSTSSSNWYGPDNPWESLFQGIRKCNIFITGMQVNTLPGNVTQKDKEQWMGEAYTMRALYYWQLVKRYGGVPIIKEELGVDHDLSSDRRATFNECVEFIIEDCRAALESPANSFPWTADQGDNNVTRGMAYAIMSEAVLYAASPKWSDGTFSWEDAAKITGEAVDACMNEGGYVLYKTAPAADVAQNAYAYFHILLSDASRSTDKETIYGYGGRQSVWRDAGLPSNDRMSTAGPCPTQEQVDAYEFVAPDGESYPVLDLNTPYIGGDHTKPNYNQQALAAGYDPQDPYASLDPRFYASIYYNGAQRNLDGTGNRVETFVGGREGLTLNIDRTHTRTGYYMRKFNNWKSSHDNSADGAVRVFRLAELLLNHAEASNEAYGPDQNPDNRMTALEAINEVRSRAGMPLLDIASQDEFRLRCRNERRVELAFEEHRYWDVRRWGILGETDRTVTGMRITKEGNRFTYTRFKVGDRACGADKFNLYPLPQSEVNKANNNTGVQWQNPGWEQ